MKIIYFKRQVFIGDEISVHGMKLTLTQEMIDDNPHMFKVKKDKPLFTTENRVEIYEGDECWCVAVKEDTCDTIFTPMKYKWNGGDRSCEDSYKWFSTKQAAEAYIEANKPKVLHITEDKVKLYKGDYATSVSKANLIINRTGVHANYNTLIYLYFSKNYIAEAYIAKHKVKTLFDYERLIIVDNAFSESAPVNNMLYRKMKEAEPKLYWMKVLQLIADDLNNGRKTQRRSVKYLINQEAGYVKTTNEYKVRSHSTIHSGAVYFRNKLDCEKAINIMGSKLDLIYK